jgi:hypothetical protein
LLIRGDEARVEFHTREEDVHSKHSLLHGSRECTFFELNNQPNCYQGKPDGAYCRNVWSDKIETVQGVSTSISQDRTVNRAGTRLSI